VVSVPEGWQPGTTEAVVTVGVQDPQEAHSLIRRGLVEARARDARVVVLHAWYVEGGYDSVVADRDFRAEQKRRTTQELTPAIVAARAEIPDVPVQLWVRHAPPAGALIDSASSSELLVIGRRHHLLPLGSHLGPVARAVLQHSTCPVVLNPETPREVPVVARDAAVVRGVVQPA
jgi:nucleotide-binding universal stress UspA family protein